VSHEDLSSRIFMKTSPGKPRNEVERPDRCRAERLVSDSPSRAPQT
jgi:hypothetical protein